MNSVEGKKAAEKCIGQVVAVGFDTLRADLIGERVDVHEHGAVTEGLDGDNEVVSIDDRTSFKDLGCAEDVAGRQRALYGTGQNAGNEGHAVGQHVITRPDSENWSDDE